LVLAQHYGLPTRLLDWTENPLVALFFALNSETNTEKAVWEINPMLSKSKDININELKNLVMFIPKSTEKRVNSQKGCFSIQPFPEFMAPYVPLEEIAYDSFSNINSLKKIVIPKDMEIQLKMMRKLSKIGITFDYIYQDLSGLTQQLIYECISGIIKNR
jgi:hypothetical protein